MNPIGESRWGPQDPGAGAPHLLRQTSRRFLALCATAALLTLACSTSELVDEGDDDAPRAPEGLWTADGLVDAMRTHFPLPPDHPEEWEPAPTRWEEVPVPPHFRAGRAEYDSPAELLLNRAAELDGGEEGGLGRDIWETTLRVLPHESDPPRATGVILQWGFKDDAVEGRDVRLHMERGDGGWFVTAMELRLHCRRGVTGGDLCL